MDRATALPELLALFEIDTRRVAVAVNGEVIPKRKHPDTIVREGDVVEVVRMVGGGAGATSAGAGRQRGASSSQTKAPTGADVVIAGAGIIGCAIAYELSRQGVSCLVLDSRRLGMASTNAAAGILAPVAEFRRPDALVQLGLASMRLYPEWVTRLREDVPDIDVEFTINGVLRVAMDDAELAELHAGLRFQEKLGVELLELDAAMVHEVEPRLNERVVGGVLGTEDGQISNQLFTLSIARAARGRGAPGAEGCPGSGFRKRGGGGGGGGRRGGLGAIAGERSIREVDFLKEFTTEDARQGLMQFKGVGPKTAAIVLQFSLDKPAFPVDTHIYRVTGRIGLRPEKMNAEKAHQHFENLLPPDSYYPAHLNIIRLGREICQARLPKCSQCPLQEVCDFRAANPDL